MSRKRYSRGRKGGHTNFFVCILLVLATILICKNLFSSSPEQPQVPTANGHDAICFVTGNVANSPSPNFAFAEKQIKEVIASTEPGELPQLCMFSTTAHPYSIELKGLEAKGNNQGAIESAKDTLVSAVNQAATSSPSESGANYYEAILRAAGYLNSYGAKNPLIVVYGSGLSDTGNLNFAFNNLLSKDLKYINNTLAINNIREGEYSNISLDWYGAGQVIRENGQAELSKNWKDKTQDIYKTALKYIGISPVFKDITISDSTRSVATEYSVNPTIIPGELKPGTKLSLNGNIARFEPDQAILKNYDEVKETLTEFAKEFNSTSGIGLKITGYQTVCGTSKSLSIDRATTIRDILVKELSVDASKITIDGVAGPQDNRTEDPRCGETGIAVEHRTVIIEVVER